MTSYTNDWGLPKPDPNDLIAGNSSNLRLDLHALADKTDQVLTQAHTQAVEDAKQEAQPRIQFIERLSSEPGSWQRNSVLDPMGIDPSSTYIGGRVSFTPAPGWGRAICTSQGAATIVPRVDGANDRAVPVKPGVSVSARAELRAMPSQDMGAYLFLYTTIWDGDELSGRAVLERTDLLSIPAGSTRGIKLQAVIPEDSDATHVEAQISFRPAGASVPEAGDFMYFRRVMLSVGLDETTGSASEYFDGDSPSAYWEGEPHKSPSVTAQPRKTGGGASVEGQAALARQALLDDFTHRRGGVKRVPGKTVISFRVDHGLANFAAKMLPKLEEYDFPYALALNSRSWGHSENAGITPSIVNSWVEGGLAEIWNHGPSHADTSDHDTIYDYIINTKAELEADIPACAPIDGYMPPGASGAGGYDGFIPTNSPQKFFGTYAGQLAMATYPAISGQLPGFVYRVQDGRPRIGHPYLNMDQFQAYQVIGRVQNAINDGRGLQLMIHPSLIDQPGYITTADLHEVIDQVKAFQDAGDVVVMSAYDQLLADATQP